MSTVRADTKLTSVVEPALKLDLFCIEHLGCQTCRIIGPIRDGLKNLHVQFVDPRMRKGMVATADDERTNTFKVGRNS